ncbi:hypothetical protein DAI22_12g072200 [Oryza sativa Japonica Group]|nr:hypothetical protein DAI22_12g072200 [Oryza sativa Japonica Group]
MPEFLLHLSCHRRIDDGGGAQDHRRPAAGGGARHDAVRLGGGAAGGAGDGLRREGVASKWTASDSVSDLQSRPISMPIAYYCAMIISCKALVITLLLINQHHIKRNRRNSVFLLVIVPTEFLLLPPFHNVNHFSISHIHIDVNESI